MFQKIKEIVALGGDIITEGFGNPSAVKQKLNENDLVTEYDTRVEEYLRKRFNEEFPDFEFIGEEAGDLEEYVSNKNLKNYFIVDPIDGTTNFIKGFPYVSISIAVYKDNKPYYGLVYNPITNELYEAIAGSGEAYCNGKNIEVSTLPSNKLLSALYVSKRRPNPPKEEVQIIQELEDEFLETRRLHSAALEICYVARGTYGIYAVNKISPWDIAAAMIILNEAGGSTTDLLGNPIDILKTKNVKAIYKK